MTGDISRQMHDHLIRADGQEDVLAAMYVPSTGNRRTTAVICGVISPRAGERLVHGNASFTSAYVLRAASEARQHGAGLVLLHSHPGGRGWQGLSAPDHDTESDYERVGRTVTGRPLLGMTLAGRDSTWSARLWTDRRHPVWAESVRTVSDRLTVSWNDALRPPPAATTSQVRTVSTWGPSAQASLARLRVLVVGAGSVGLDVAQRLAATGLVEVGVMDFDAVEPLNLDRLIGATKLDARLGRAKVDVAARLMRSAATANEFKVNIHESSVSDPDGLQVALDYDVIFSCVDRPWPRAVLNAIAYADLIPVIDGGIALDTTPDGRFRGGIWRAHTLVPERPCMQCIGQLEPGDVSLDQGGLLDDPQYIERSGRENPARQNVAAISAGVSAALLAQFVTLTTHPGNLGVPAPLRYMIAPHVLQHGSASRAPYCTYESELATGDRRPSLARPQDGWREITGARRRRPGPTRLRVLDWFERVLQRAVDRL